MNKDNMNTGYHSNIPSDEELRRIFDGNGVNVPDGLGKDLSDMIDSMDAAEKIVTGGKSRMRRTVTYIMGIAAGIVLVAGIWTAVETYRTPEDTFSDPALAYAEVEKALSMISDRMSSGAEKADAATRAIERQRDRIESLLGSY